MRFKPVICIWCLCVKTRVVFHKISCLNQDVDYRAQHSSSSNVVYSMTKWYIKSSPPVCYEPQCAVLHVSMWKLLYSWVCKCCYAAAVIRTGTWSFSRWEMKISWFVYRHLSSYLIVVGCRVCTGAPKRCCASFPMCRLSGLNGSGHNNPSRLVFTNSCHTTRPGGLSLILVTT